MRRLTISIALLCFAASPAFAQKAPFFVGKWYIADAKVCKKKPGDAEGLLTYTDKKFFGYESRCDIARQTPKGKAIELQLNCSGEGEKYKDSEVVELVEGNKLKRTVTVEGKKTSFTYPRCP